MTKIKPFINATILCATIIICVTPQCLAALSDKQLCYDPNCSEPISLAKTIISYTANDREVMSFAINENVKVFSKGAGKRTDLWGVEINGKRGFAPKSFLKETTILKRDLLHEVPVYKFDGKANKVQPKTLQSTEEESSKGHLLKDKLSDDNGTPLLKSIDESITEEPHTINADSVSQLYEVIDGTTVYVESDPSVQPSSVTEASRATALPNEQTSVTSDSEKLSFDKNINNKELNGLDTDNSNKEPEFNVENLELITTSILDTADKDKISTLDKNEFKEELATNIEQAKELESSVGENVQDDNGGDEEEEEEEEEEDEEEEEEEITKNVENDGIFASITKMFSSEETVTVGSTTIQDNGITSTPETVVDSKLYLDEQNAEVKDDVTKKIISPTETKIESSIDQNFIDKKEVESQQEIIHADKSAKTLNGKIEEAPIIILENTTSPSDVPSNNFVHENADKPAKELSIEPLILINDKFSSKTIDSRSENIEIQKSSEAEKIAEDVTINDKYSDKENSTILSNSQEPIDKKITTSESGNNVEQKLSESNETNLENTSKDSKETDDQVDKTVIPKDSKLYPKFIDLPPETIESIPTKSVSENQSVDENVEKSLNQEAINIQINNESITHSNVNNDYLINDTSSDNVPIESNEFSNNVKSSVLGVKQSVDSSQESMNSEQSILNDVLKKPDLSTIEENLEHQDTESQIVSSVKKEEETLPEYGDYINNEDKVLYGNEDNGLENPESTTVFAEMEDKTCIDDHKCEITEFVNQGDFESEEDNFIDSTKLDHNYWKTLIYLCITAFTTLVFTLGYYYIENIRRDGQLIARINKLEKELLVSTKECEVLSEDLKSTKDKLHCIEDKSFGSNEMVVSLKSDLAKSQNAKVELEEQVTMLEKDLENATEAGLELERMLREVLASNNEVNPLAQSVEDLQARLDAQQTANESLTNALNLKAQELNKFKIETLTIQLTSAKKRCEELEVEYVQIQDKLTTEKNLKNNLEQKLTDTIHTLEKQVTELSTEKSSLYKELKGKEIEVKELMEIINQLKSNNLDLEKLYDVSRIKIEAVQLREERDELQIRLNDVEGAHQLLEEHMKFVKEEINVLSDQCTIAEKEKKDAETRLEVLSKFFQEKETERQKEEAIWLQKQGEVVSTVERLHMMQNEIQNYKQQVEILKREIMDQEREYKNQISTLEMKAHEQWVTSRQNERRLEESKAEARQLRNHLTLVEKSLNDIDPETKLHRLEANGETATSPPLFAGAESSSSPIMFSGSSGVPPPPLPSYLHFPPYLPPLPPNLASGLPPYDISQRPPPLGGRLSSPPPMLPPPALHRPPVSGGRYENAGSPPPPMSPPHILPPYDHHRSPPPPFDSDHIPPLPPPGSLLPPLGVTHPWGEDSLPHPRNSGFHPHQREQRARNHKGSLHSSGESLDKAHHGKV
ncbi:hypothetical protein PUN28_009987 [Cardiocondyla obscurior]|uniref:Transport and Golgi organization protein 1 n=1 Tax=Cardiocondyla obscurior TaxID=286306 RepID=A0AAW2FLQ2_9HYME